MNSIYVAKLFMKSQQLYLSEPRSSMVQDQRPQIPHLNHTPERLHVLCMQMFPAMSNAKRTVCIYITRNKIVSPRSLVRTYAHNISPT